MKTRLPIRRIALALLLALSAAAVLLFQQQASLREKAPAVDYVLLNGASADSSQWAGKVMLVNFWATSCTACVHEMPQLITLHEKFKHRGFDILAVSMSYDPPARVADFASSRKLPFGVAIDSSGTIAKRFGEVRLTPTTVLINKHGEIVQRYLGVPDFAALESVVESLLTQS
jgi:peroxiredoxin